MTLKVVQMICKKTVLIFGEQKYFCFLKKKKKNLVTTGEIER